MIYLDNNATTTLAPEVAGEMRDVLVNHFGNPSSAHAAGERPRRFLEESREVVRGFLGAVSAKEITFTSGGTESDNWAILGALEIDAKKKHIVTTRVEHEAVRKLCEKLERSGHEVTWIEVDELGRLDLEQLCRALRPDTAIVSVMMANNETGVIFPVQQAAEIVKEHSRAIFHVDAVNAAGKCRIDLTASNIDLLSISAHKFHGPKGVGALYVRDGVRFPPISIGGGQEGGKRAGTEAVHQIVGMATAARLAATLSHMESVRALRDELEAGLSKLVPDIYINGDRDNRVPNTSNISFESVNGEMLLHRLDRRGICVSTGSACHSGSNTTSPVLEAMNVPFKRAMGSIRFSLSRFSRRDEVQTTVQTVAEEVHRLRAMT